MTDQTPAYDLAAIRDLLLRSFTAETYRRFLFYTENPALHPLLYEISPGDGLLAMVDKTIEYCHNRRLLDELLLECERAGVEPPLPAESYLTQGQRLIEAGSYDEAIRLLKRVHNIYPQNERIEWLLLNALYNKAVQSYVRHYDLGQARRALQEVLIIDPFYPNASQLLSEVERQPQAAPAQPLAPAARPTGRQARPASTSFTKIKRIRAIGLLLILTGILFASALAGLISPFPWAAVLTVLFFSVLPGLILIFLAARKLRRE